MSIQALSLGFQTLFLMYFIGLNGGYLILYFFAIFYVQDYMRTQAIQTMPLVYLGLEPPISVLCPAYNEEATITDSVKSLLQLQYAEYEIIIINDGSKDATMETLIQEFALEPFPEAYRVRLVTQPIRALYQSTRYPNLRVIDKQNGGKADSLNAGLNCARSPLFCCVDADSILQRDSLQKVVQPFLDDPRTVASGGCIRIANGCDVQGGFLTKTGLPRNPLALFQIAEYLRAFLFGRLGWSPLNALLIISGAFGLFNKEQVIAVGGYRVDTIGEDMELVVRLHSYLRLAKIPYRIVYVPDPICWTEAPEDLRTLKTQRVRWQRGLGESLAQHWRLFMNPRAGTVGLLAFPFMLLFELLGPLLEVTGFVFVLVGFAMGIVSGQALVAFLCLAIGLGMVLSVCALLLEELTFHLYPRLSHVAILFLAVVLENLGYRQLNSMWRVMGLFQWAFGKKGHAKWGEMKRTAAWSRSR